MNSLILDPNSSILETMPRNRSYHSEQKTHNSEQKTFQWTENIFQWKENIFQCKENIFQCKENIFQCKENIFQWRENTTAIPAVKVACIMEASSDFFLKREKVPLWSRGCKEFLSLDNILINFSISTLEILKVRREMFLRIASLGYRLVMWGRGKDNLRLVLVVFAWRN